MYPFRGAHGLLSRARTAAVLAGGLLASSLMAQTTVGVGQTLQVTFDTTFSASSQPPGTINLGTLTMDGGTIRMSNGATGQPQTIMMLDAVLARGRFDHPYSQTGVSQLFFNGTTSVTGGAVGPFPADGMSIRASSFDSRGLQVYSSGILVQSGTGSLATQGPVQFNNVGTFEIQNDLGFQAGDFKSSGFIPFANTGLLKKKGGTGLSTIDAVFDQLGGQVEAHTGSLLLTRGGLHVDATFATYASGGNPVGQIILNGPHTFAGRVDTQGVVALSSTGSLEAAGDWDQYGTFGNAGNIRISAGGFLTNSGYFLDLGGSINGQSSAFGGTIVNTASGSFSSNIALAPLAAYEDHLNVINRGRFIVAAHQTVEVKHFNNEAGNVTVNGEVWNLRGTFKLLGGSLDGTGIINGDVFIGGGPGVAVFKPGSSPGVMTINGPLSLLPGGVIELEVERDPLTGAILYDQIIADSFFFDGQISFLIGAGVELADVAGLPFLQCTFGCNIEYGAEFSSLFPGRAGSTLSFDANGLTITALAPVPEPETYAMLLAGLGLIGALARRRQQQRYRT